MVKLIKEIPLSLFGQHVRNEFDEVHSWPVTVN